LILKGFSVNIIALSNRVHEFKYEFGDEFFRFYGSELVSAGPFHADVALNKHETFIEADFNIKGALKLVCDRSLEPFDQPVKLAHRIMFKFGDHDEEITDEIIMIHRDTVTLELGHYIYEFISLAVPLKKLHPKFQGDADESEGGIIYTSSDDSSDDDETDPRWDILKKLK
jgi:uncharacterized metal-binding protein YceD (DUF177 family)